MHKQMNTRGIETSSFCTYFVAQAVFYAQALGLNNGHADIYVFVAYRYIGMHAKAQYVMVEAYYSSMRTSDASNSISAIESCHLRRDRVVFAGTSLVALRVSLIFSPRKLFCL